MYVAHNETIPVAIGNPRIVSAIENETCFTAASKNWRLTNFVIFAKNVKVLNSLLLKLKSSYLWHEYSSSRGNFLVIMVMGKEEETSWAFNLLWNHELFSALVMVLDGNEVYYDFPFETVANDCGRNSHPKPIAVNCSDFRNLRFPVFGAKTRFHGCTLNVMYDVIFRKMPYNGNPYSSEPGLYLKPLIEFAKKANFTLSFEPEPAYSALEYVNNLTAHGTERILNSKEQDLVVALTNRIAYFYELFEMSDIVYQEPQIWVLPKPKRVSNMRIIFLTFTNTEWSIILAVFLTVNVVWSLVTKLNLSSALGGLMMRNFMHVIAVTFSSSLHVVLRSRSLNILFLFYVFYCFYVNFYFQARLSSLLIKPLYEDPIRNEDELANSSLVPVINNHKIVYFLTQNDSVAVALGRKSVSTPDGKMHDDPVNFVYENGSVTTTAFPSAMMLIENYDAKVNYIETRLIMGMEAMYMYRKGYPLVPLINRYLNKFKEGGFFSKWLSDVRWPKVKRIPTKAVVLNLAHLQAVFVILVIGLSTGSVAFILEFSYYHHCKSNSLIVS